MCCLEKPKGRQKEGSEARRGRGRGGGPPCLKTRKKGGEGKKEEQTGRGGSGVEVRGGWLAPWLGRVWREGAEPG